MSFTKTRNPGPADRGRALRVPHGSIGRGHAGKSVLLRAARRRTLQRKLPSGLSFDVDDPRKTVDLLKEARSTRELLERRGLPATQEAEELAIELFADDRKLVVLQTREAIGQVYSHTSSESSADQMERFRQHVEHLAQASVLWVVLSVPSEGSTRRALSRYEDDLLMMRSYLRESLRLRRPERTCAVAIVITKLDTLFETEEEARRRWPDDEVVRTVAPLVGVIEESEKVEWSIINPVSAFGFGNAELLDASDGGARVEADEGEAEWVLRRDAAVEPYNVVPLITWTFLGGMLSQEVSPEEGAMLAKVCRLLRADLKALDGWQIPIKGQG